MSGAKRTNNGQRTKACREPFSTRLQQTLPSILRPFIRRMSAKPIEIDLSEKLDRVVDLNAPPLDELLPLLCYGMQGNFAETSVEIVECSDLSLEPFGFTGKGIGSDLRVAEVGGQGNLFPCIRKEKKIAEVCELPECFIFGPGAGPRNSVGVNCEMVADACFGESNSKVNTHICKIVKSSYKQEEISDPCCGPLANLGLCRNELSSPVLKITAKRRIGQLNFPETIRQIISQHYGAKLVSMAGVFLVEKGKVMVHVMPDFPENDFYSRDELQNEWLQYFEVTAPLVCASVLHSTDPDLDLRLEHTHLFSSHNDAGHYHYDTTPETVEYTGYFKPAEKLYRIDQVDIQGREIDLV